MKTGLRFLIIMCTCVSLLCASCKKDLPDDAVNFQLLSIQIGSSYLNLVPGAVNTNIPTDAPIIFLFSKAIDSTTATKGITLTSSQGSTALHFTFTDGNKNVSAAPATPLLHSTDYTISIHSSLKEATGASFSEFSITFTTAVPILEIDSLTVSGQNLLTTARVTDVDRNFSAYIQFNMPVDPATVNSGVFFVSGGSSNAPLTFTLQDSNRTVLINTTQPLIHFERYVLTITSSLKGMDGASFPTFAKEFFTAVDTTPKFPLMSDDDLLTLIQQQTFKYFWDFAHPACGLARERNTSGDVVTTGGSGFGLMATVVGISRNFISRSDGLARLDEELTFLETCDRFHGAYPHWLNGATGSVVPFSPEDDGADLVETSYLMMGLLTFRQYLNPGDSYENSLITRINALWDAVEWDWFTKGGQDALYWHWSPDFGWAMNMQINGYNEALITYLLAAASGTHPISASVYNNGWAGNGSMENGNTFYGYLLPLGPDYGGPLFFTQYTWLGFNPTNLSDQYANYETQNVNHTLINQAYCVDNPLSFVGYSASCWGLTASDDPDGYDAHEPGNDNGTISPTAAISSMPYNYDNAMKALKFFYYTIGDKTWGEYGFYDAFNVTQGWWANSYLAIDEGPIIGMIENYRTGLLWNLFMSCPEVQTAMTQLGFTN